MAIKEKLEDVGRLLLRAGVGVNLAWLHGWSKARSFSEGSANFPDPLHIGARWSHASVAAAEFVCAILLVLGVATRFNAAVIAFTMGVAAFVGQATLPWARKETAVMYLAGALAVLLLGPGRLSFDNFLWRRGKGAGSRAAKRPVPSEA